MTRRFRRRRKTWPLAVSGAVLALLVFAGPIGSQSPQRAGVIVPQPSPDSFPDPPRPLTFRVVNRGAKPIYLQGFRDREERLQLYFYHREGEEGWKPFFDALPCDLPTCRNLRAAPRNGCLTPIPFVIPLGSAGAPDAVKEVRWEGLLYQRSEATQEDRSRRYCYKGWAPKRGRMRVEVEFSETIQEEKEKRGMIGGRDHAAIEFDLPASQDVYEIPVGSRSAPNAPR